MGIPTSEVGYTSVADGRETTKSIRDMWWHWKTTTTTTVKLLIYFAVSITLYIFLNK
jgi:hypothetical protein